MATAAYPYSCVFEVGGDGRREMMTEYACHEGSARYKLLALKCLARCPSENGRYTFGAEGFTYNFLVDQHGGLVYGVVAAESESRCQCFDFLRQVQQELRVSVVACGPTQHLSPVLRCHVELDMECAGACAERLFMQSCNAILRVGREVWILSPLGLGPPRVGIQVHRERKVRQSDSSEATSFRFSMGCSSMQESRDSVQNFKPALSEEQRQQEKTGGLQSVRVFASAQNAMSRQPSRRYDDDDAIAQTPTTPRDLFRPVARTTHY